MFVLRAVLRQEERAQQLAAGDGGVVEGHELPPDEDAGSAEVQPALWTRADQGGWGSEQTETEQSTEDNVLFVSCAYHVLGLLTDCSNVPLFKL